MKDVSEDFTSPPSFLFTDCQNKRHNFTFYNIYIIDDCWLYLSISVFFLYFFVEINSCLTSNKGTTSTFTPGQPRTSFQEATCSLVEAPIHRSMSSGGWQSGLQYFCQKNFKHIVQGSKQMTLQSLDNQWYQSQFPTWPFGACLSFTLMTLDIPKHSKV